MRELRAPLQLALARARRHPQRWAAASLAIAKLLGAVLAQAAQDGQTVICASHDPQIISQADEVMAVG